MIRFISIFILAIVIWACITEADPLYNPELIFTNSYPIVIDEYTYIDEQSQKVIQVYGDSIASNRIDSLSSTPSFAWNTLQAEYAAAAIFTEPIKVKGSKIQNYDSRVWEWNSGMNSILKDTIQYSEGTAVNNGTIVDGMPQALSPGNYYWAVWAWGQSGVYILYSSRETPFYVSK